MNIFKAFKKASKVVFGRTVDTAAYIADVALIPVTSFQNTYRIIRQNKGKKASLAIAGTIQALYASLGIITHVLCNIPVQTVPKSVCLGLSLLSSYLSNFERGDDNLFPLSTARARKRAARTSCNSPSLS